MQASIFSACPKPGYSGRVVAGRASSVKMEDDGGGSLISPDGVAPTRMVGVSASVIFSCTIKSRRRFVLAPAHLGNLGTQQQQQPFYSPLSGNTRVSQYQKKHSPTHHPDHHPIFISFFHLPRSIASSLFKLRAWQSFFRGSPGKGSQNSCACVCGM